MNGETSGIEHVADSDSGARGMGETFAANPSDLRTLDDLAAFVRKTDLRQLNEVNAHFKVGDVLGLFGIDTRSPRPKVELLAAQARMREKGLDLPMYLYDASSGTLQKWTPSREQVVALVSDAYPVSSSVSRTRQQLGAPFRQALDVTVNEASTHCATKAASLQR